MIDIGFTGSRNGPTELSMATFNRIINRLKPDVFRHGACRGWDAAAVKVIHELFPKCEIIAYPGRGAQDGISRLDRDRESIDLSNIVKPEKSHLARNRDIVRDSCKIIGCPPTMDHQNHGGTWFTIDYANKNGKLGVIIGPDGTTRYRF